MAREWALVKTSGVTTELGCDPIVRASVEADLALAGHYGGLIRSIERTILEQAKVEDISTVTSTPLPRLK